MSNGDLDQRVAAVRRFNRFYTRQIGLLQKGLLNTPFTLSEARVLYELGQQASTTASQLSQELGLDPAQMSRILQSLSRRALIHRQRSTADRRQTCLSLTTAGEGAFATLNTRSHEAIRAMLGPLASAEQDRLANAMRTIKDPATGGGQSSVSVATPPTW